MSPGIGNGHKEYSASALDARDGGATGVGAFIAVVATSAECSASGAKAFFGQSSSMDKPAPPCSSDTRKNQKPVSREILSRRSVTSFWKALCMLATSGNPYAWLGLAMNPASKAAIHRARSAV
jgi:hypothetical protein